MKKDMFLNFLIITTVFILIILIGIKFGKLLPILAIILSIFALIPIAYSTYFYFNGAPKIDFHLVKHNFSGELNPYAFDVGIGITTEGTPGILKGFHVVSEHIDGLGITKHSILNDKIIFNSLEEGFGGFTVSKVISEHYNIISKHHIHDINFRYSRKDKNPIDNIPIKILVDIEVDRLRLGFLSILLPNISYRYLAETTILTNDPNRQEGILKRAYW